MNAYINGTSCISHYNTFSESFFFEAVKSVPNSNNFTANEPNYKDYVPANLMRRMSRIVKMGVCTSAESLKKAGLDNVDAIVVGTGIGCYEDTDKFLRSLIENKEEMLTPTAFIQSTHNTVSGQIAMLIKCHGYNFTYVHQNLSFESALLDGMMLLNEKSAKQVLVGGIDETNASLLELFSRAGHIKKENELNPVWSKNSKGYYNGEGAAFFNISAEKTSKSLAKIEGVQCFNQIFDAKDLATKTAEFLKNIGLQKVDLILSGNCGDSEMDKIINEFNTKAKTPIAYFKNACGEYFTSSAFAMWLATEILHRQVVPSVLSETKIELNDAKYILIVNHYHNKQYSLTCLSKC